MTDPTTAYAKAVLAGEIVAGPHVRNACRRHFADLERNDVRFDVKAARRVFSFFERKLRLPKGKNIGKPFKLFPWQKFLIGSLYGWKRGDWQRFRRAYVETSKGTGKSPLAAGLALYSIYGDDEYAAEGYIIAKNADQALITFRLARQIRDQSPDIRGSLKVVGGHNPVKIVHGSSDSFIERTTSNESGEGKSGLNPHLIVVDEYHEHKTATMMERYDSGMKDRPQPLRICITNAGAGMEIPCWAEHAYAIKAAAGDVSDDSYFAYVCALDEGDDPWKSEDCWLKVSPSLPVIPGHDYIRDQVDKGRGMPSKRAEVERFQFCVWTGAVNPWIDSEAWKAVEVDKIDESELLDAPCTIGLDLSRTRDLTAAVAVWVLPNGRYAARAHAWTPGDTIAQRSEAEAIPYVEWRDGGYLTATPGAIVDYEFVAHWIRQLTENYHVRALVYDAWGMGHFRENMGRCGLELTDIENGSGLYSVSHRQGFLPSKQKGGAPALWMHSSIEALERAVLERTIEVERNPVLRWAVLGAAVISDGAGNRKLSKIKEESRIDAMVALTMAMGFVTAKPPEAANPLLKHYQSGNPLEAWSV